MTETSRKLMLIQLSVSALAAVVGFIVTKDVNFLLGLLLGAAVSVLRVILLDNAVRNLADIPQEKAAVYMQSRYMLRFLLMAGALVASVFIFRSDATYQWGIIGCAIGILSLQVAGYLVKFFLK